MNSEIAQQNLVVLTGLAPHTKLKSNSAGLLSIDDRILPSVRRAITQDSRLNLISLLRQTFEASSTYTSADKLQVLIALKPVLSETYPDYAPLQELFAELMEKFAAVSASAAPPITTIVEKSQEKAQEITETPSPMILHNLDSLKFKQSLNNTRSVESENGQLIVTTYESRNAYQLASKPIILDDLSAIEIFFEVDLIKGGFGLGLLDTNGKWVPGCHQNFSKTGLIKSSIRLKLDAELTELVLIFYNCCSPAAQSIFAINSVDCYGWSSQA